MEQALGSLIEALPCDQGCQAFLVGFSFRLVARFAEALCLAVLVSLQSEDILPRRLLATVSLLVENQSQLWS